jgi:dTDP-4-amino-4,6-dideoxygalactose transaminase
MNTQRARSNRRESPGRDAYLVFGRPHLLEPEIEEVVATLRSGWLCTGPKVAAFEKAFGEYVGSRYAVAVSSCTAGLHLALVAAGLKPGDEVVLPALTFAATANAVIHAGGRPILADVDLRTMCLEPEDVERRITPRTRAIIPVHFAGRACRMGPLRALAQRHNLKIIEDCAHAIETVHHDHHAGTLGDVAAFSFHATKNVVTGEGGMVTTANPEWQRRIKTLSQHGLSADTWTRRTDAGCMHYEVLEPGFKYNMTDLQAALGLHQLRRAEENLARRQQIWGRYDEALAELPVFVPPPAEKATRHARHLYTLLLDVDQLSVGRDEVQIALHRQRIGTGIHYRALHLHRYFRETFGYARGDLPNADWISDRTLSLPLSPTLTDKDVEDVIRAVRRTLKYFAR